MADETPVTWPALERHCEKNKDNCHELLTERFQNAVNNALDAKLSEKGIVVMSRLHYNVTVCLAIGTGFGGVRALQFVATAMGLKVGP